MTFGRSDASSTSSAQDSASISLGLAVASRELTWTPRSPPFHEARTQPELAVMIREGKIPDLPKPYSSHLNQVVKAMLRQSVRSRLARLEERSCLTTGHTTAKGAAQHGSDQEPRLGQAADSRSGAPKGVSGGRPQSPPLSATHMSHMQIARAAYAGSARVGP